MSVVGAVAAGPLRGGSVRRLCATKRGERPLMEVAGEAPSVLGSPVGRRRAAAVGGSRLPCFSVSRPAHLARGADSARAPHPLASLHPSHSRANMRKPPWTGATKSPKGSQPCPRQACASIAPVPTRRLGRMGHSPRTSRKPHSAPVTDKVASRPLGGWCFSMFATTCSDDYTV